MLAPRSDRQVYGHIRDPLGHRRTPAVRLFGASGYPTSASLESFLPDVLSQGQTGRCVGFGTAGAIYTSGQKKIFLPSPTGIYTNARAIDRLPHLDGSLDPLVDEGSMPNQADRAIAEFGISAFDPSIDGEVISDDDLNAEPALLTLEADSANLVVGAYSLDETAADFEAQVARALSSGYAIRYAIPDVDDSFERYNGGVLGAATGQRYGGHAVFAFGYEISPDAQFYVDSQNSWGKGWGLNGRFRGGRAFMKRWVDVQAMRVSLRGAAS